MNDDSNHSPKMRGGRRLTAARWLGTPLLIAASFACSPTPPREYVKPQLPAALVDPERLLSARELGDLLPDWSLTADEHMVVDYAGLKAAAIALARMPADARRITIIAYSRAYCDLPWIAAHCATGGVDRDGRDHVWPEADFRKASGMYVLLRVLFVLPARYPASEREKFTGWMRMPPRQGDDDEVLWPVHADSSGHVLLVERCEGFRGRVEASVYRAMDEYDYFLSRYPMRTPVMLEALDIRPADASEGVGNGKPASPRLGASPPSPSQAP